MSILPIDYIVMIVYIIFTIWLGVYASKYAGGREEMLVAGRKIGLFGMLATLIATDWCAITMVYMGQSGWAMGISAMFLGWLIFAGYVGAGMFGVGTVWFRRLKILSIPEVMEHRYGKIARALTGFSMVMAFLVTLGVFLQGVAGMFGTFFGVDPRLMIFILLAIAMGYTISGGMWSVILTDQVQFLILGIIIPLATILAIKGAGGWEALYSGVQAARGEVGVNGWTAFGTKTIIYQLVFFFFAAFAYPTTLMRVCSARSVREGYKGFTIGVSSFLSRAIFPAIVGAAAIILFPDLKDGVQAYAMTITKVTPVGLTGVLIAGFMAAFMSTADSYYLTTGSMIPQDIIGPLLPKGKTLSTKQTIITLRLSIVFVALFALYVAYFYKGGLLYWVVKLAEQMFVAGLGISVVFGLWWKKANQWGAVTALVFGLIGCAIPNYVLKMEAWQTGFISFGGALIGMVVVSLLTQKIDRPKTVGSIYREARSLANGMD
jgi:SSS family solute:Na+ symporter